MSRHRKETIYKTTTERLAKGVGGALLVASGALYGAAIVGDGLTRIAETEFNAPEQVGDPVQELAEAITPDFVAEPVHGVMDELGFGITELGLGAFCIIGADAGVRMMGRALRTPPLQEPPAGAPKQ